MADDYATPEGPANQDARPVIVYQAVNLINGHRYIGVTKQGLAARRSKHRYESSKTSSTCRYFHVAIRHYGWDAFRFSVVRTCHNYRSAQDTEIRLIAAWKPEYNITSGGEGSPGHVVSPETRAKIAASHIGTMPWNKGRPHPLETRLKIAAKAKGRKPSPETLAAMKGRVTRARPVVCLTDGMTFATMRAAELHYGLKTFSVSSAIYHSGGRCQGRVFECQDNPNSAVSVRPPHGMLGQRKGLPGTFLGRKHSDATRALMSQRAKTRERRDSGAG